MSHRSLGPFLAAAQSIKIQNRRIFGEFALTLNVTPHYNSLVQLDC